MAKFPSPTRVKVHRNYSVAQIAALLAVHKHTVRRWIAEEELAVVGGHGETIVLGADLREFLTFRRKSAKRPCRIGEMYCLPCQARRVPAGGMTEYVRMTSTGGNVRAICPVCDRLMHRRIRGDLYPAFAAAAADRHAHLALRLVEGLDPSDNVDS